MKRIKHIELSFQCQEEWNKMVPNSMGRHCSSCEKTVVDFSTMSNAQIIAFFSQETNAIACGRFRNGQLDYLIRDLTTPIKKERPALITSLYLGLFVGLISCQKSPSSSSTIAKREKKELLVTPSKLSDPVKNPSEDNDVTGKKEDVFSPRKISHVDSLKKPKQLSEIRIEEHSVVLMLPEYHLTGIPIATFEEIEETTRFEQFLHKINPAKKKWWSFLRIRKERNSNSNQ